MLSGEQKGNGIPDSDFADVDITNDYMFSTVMQNSALCMELLESLLPGTKIQKLNYIQFDEDGSEINSENTRTAVQSETQKTVSGYFGFRGVRLDAYVDDGKSVYNIEMQTTDDRALAKRCRLYQSHIDISQLRRGENYDKLRPCFVIFICKYDPFGLGYYRYSFQNRCDENNGLMLNDGAYKLFFNTAGYIGEISPQLRELLKYMNDPGAYSVNESSNDLIQKIERAVNTAKMNQEWRDAFMTYQMKQREAELRGEARGRAEGKKENATETAKKMIRRAMPDDLIAELSGLSISDVNALKEQTPH